MAAADRVAAEDPSSEAGLRGLRRHSWLWLLGAAVALVAAIVLAASEVSATERLDEVGRRVPGEVTAVDRTSRGGQVAVAYDDGDGPQRLEIRLDQGSPRYAVGQAVTVLVDPDDPSIRGLLGEDDSSMLVVAAVGVLLTVGAAGLAVGVAGLVRLRRLRRILRRHPWRAVRSRYVQRPAGRSVRQGVVVDAPAGPRSLQLAGAWLWTVDRAGVRDAEVVEVAGPPEGAVAIRARAGGPVLAARDPRSRRVWGTDVLGTG